MSLEDLQKKVYKPGDNFKDRLNRPGLEAEAKKTTEQKWQTLEKKKGFFSRFSSKQRKYFKYGFFALVFLSLLGVGYVVWQDLNSFNEDRINLSIDGPEKVTSGEEAIYTVSYTNNSKVALRDVKLTFYYPEKSIPQKTDDLIQVINQSDLQPGERAEVKLPARIIGFKDETKQAQARLNYQPVSFSAFFENKTDFTSTVLSVPLSLDFDLPPQLTTGQAFNFSLEYLNEAEVAFDNIQLRLYYPDGFSFESAEPTPDEGNNVWNIGNLMAGEQKSLFIKGSIDGKEGFVKKFKAEIGSFKNNNFIGLAELSETVQISTSPLVVDYTVNGENEYIASAGQKLIYQIDYKNTANVAIEDIVITAQLNGDVFDLSTLNPEQGSFDDLNRRLVWRASDVTQLKKISPQESGSLIFKIKVKKPLPINGYADKNFILTSQAKIDSVNPPISLGGIEVASQVETKVKISTNLDLQAKAFYYDDIFNNTGSIPPRVGQPTTYTLKWELTNTANDLEDVKVSAYLPTHIKWKGAVKPNGSGLEYSPASGELVWTVGYLSAATGVLLPTKWVAFQIEATPSITHKGSYLELIGQSKASGQDAFTGFQVSDLGKTIDTRLPDDPQVDDRDGRVEE